MPAPAKGFADLSLLTVLPDRRHESFTISDYQIDWLSNMTERYQCKQMIGHPDSYRDVSGYMMSLTFQVIEPTVYYIITICESKKIVPSTAGLPAEGYSVRRQVIVKKYNPLCAGMALRTLIGLLPGYKYLALLTTK